MTCSGVGSAMLCTYPLDPGQRAGLGLQFAVDGLGGIGELDEPVAFDRGLAGYGLADLLVDALERPAGPIVLVLVVPHLVAAFVARPGRPRLNEHLPVG